MGRAMEILVATSALAGIATFLGFRTAARQFVRKLGRPPEQDERRTDVGPNERR